MGREARRRRREQPIDNRGDLDRVEAAIGSFLRRLKVDPRLVAQYTAWCHGRDLPRLMTAPVSDYFPDLKAAAIDNLMAAVLRAPSETERARVYHVLEGMGPSRSWPRRQVADALLSQVWPSAFYTAIQRPELTQSLWVTVRDDGAIRLTYGPDAPPVGGRWVMRKRGHRPQAIGHAKIQQAIDTWFAAYLEDPPVPVPVLTQKYAIEANRLTEAHSVVADRLELAESLLNRWLEA